MCGNVSIIHVIKDVACIKALTIIYITNNLPLTLSVLTLVSLRMTHLSLFLRYA